MDMDFFGYKYRSDNFYYFSDHTTNKIEYFTIHLQPYINYETMKLSAAILFFLWERWQQRFFPLK
jgi:hypothetical protein